MPSKIHWVIVPTMAALARNVKNSAQALTPTDLSTWVADDGVELSIGMAAAALDRLRVRGFVRPQVPIHYKTGAINRWLVTPLGLLAAQAALRSLPTGPAPDVHDLSTRLWNLLRIRRRITAAEAAQTLVDADENFDAQAKRIGALLAAWAKLPPYAVVTALKRESGRIRYVLVQDLGRWPPPSRPGQMHPSDFSNAPEIPAHHLKGGGQP